MPRTSEVRKAAAKDFGNAPRRESLKVEKSFGHGQEISD